MNHFDYNEIFNNFLCMPDPTCISKATEYLEALKTEGNSSGGIIDCVVKNLPAGIGDPVFEKLDANLAKAIMSIGSVKGVEIGDGFEVAKRTGSDNNDGYTVKDGKIIKKTNHAGGMVGGISDGSEVFIRAAIKPTPSIYKSQQTVNQSLEEIEINIEGRHDPIIVPRAVVVVESMVALTIVDALLMNMCAKMDNVLKVYKN
jgi:chorismate synthase